MKTKFVLAQFLPYLLNRAGVKIGLSFGRDIAPLDINLPMWRVLVALWESGDQRLGELAERTSIDMSTLSRLLVTLQRRQYISRGRSGTDGRALSVTLTDKGRKMTERVIPIAQHYEDVAIRGFSRAEVARLKRTLTAMYANIQTFDHERATDAPSKAKSPGRRPKARKTSKTPL